MTNFHISQATQFTADGFKWCLLVPLNVNFSMQLAGFYTNTLATAQVLMKVCEKQKQAAVLQEPLSES